MSDEKKKLTPAEMEARLEAQEKLVNQLLDKLTKNEERTAGIEKAILTKEEMANQPRPEYAKAPWEEVIWVEPLVNCVYPNPPDHQDYLGGVGILRMKRDAAAGRRGDVHRLMHREHLNRHLVEISAEEAKTALPVKEELMPITSARPSKNAPQVIVTSR